MRLFKDWLRARLAFIVSCLGLGLGPCRIIFGNCLTEHKFVKQQAAEQDFVKQRLAERNFVPPANKLSERKNHDNRRKIKRTGKRGK